MLILETSQVPASTADLIDVVDRSIRKWIQVPASTQLIQASGQLPRLTSAAVNLSGGTGDSSRGIPEYVLTPATEAGPTIAAARVTAKPLTVDGIAIDFDLTATDLAFGYARSQTGQLVVTLESAAQGKLLLEMSRANLETAILKTAQTAAASSGVAILKVESTLNSISPRELEVKLNITAKKFVTTTIRISGRLTIDEELNATATDLKADGDGMVGAIAVGFLRPQLDKIQARPMPLMQFSLGKVKLHDVAVNTSNGLKITAEFGNQS
jgi:hypothetical protein